MRLSPNLVLAVCLLSCACVRGSSDSGRAAPADEPARTLVYRTTLINPLQAPNVPRHPEAMRATWTLDLHASRAVLRRVRESSRYAERPP